ncbi:MAG: hypothetical protein AB1776_06820 [Bacillota bacterium]
MSYHDLVRRAIAIDEQEIVLWMEIASMVPSRPLQEAIRRMAEEERESIAFWRSVLGEALGAGAATYEAGSAEAAGERGPGFLHHRIRQALLTNLEEIALWAEIASRVPSDALRLRIILRLPEEVGQVTFWDTLLLAYPEGMFNV